MLKEILKNIELGMQHLSNDGEYNLRKKGICSTKEKENFLLESLHLLTQ